MEHIRDLDRTIDRFHELLGPPAGCTWKCPTPAAWIRAMDAPFQEFSVEHINYFSPVSLNNLMTQRGFRVVASGRASADAFTKSSPGPPRESTNDRLKRGAAGCAMRKRNPGSPRISKAAAAQDARSAREDPQQNSPGQPHPRLGCRRPYAAAAGHRRPGHADGSKPLSIPTQISAAGPARAPVISPERAPFPTGAHPDLLTGVSNRNSRSDTGPSRPRQPGDPAL